MLDLVRSFSEPWVGACAFTFGGGDEEIVSVNREGAGVPVGGDETEGLQRAVTARLGGSACCIEDCHRIERCVGNEQLVAIRGLGQSYWRSPREVLIPSRGMEQAEQRTILCRNHGDFIRVRQRNIKRFLIGAEQHRRRM